MVEERKRAGAVAQQASLSGRLNRLFEVHRPPDAPERMWRNSEVVAACKANGREFSESHLSELRRGVKQNPTVRTLEALAWFFDVSIGYFTDPAVAAELELELAVREAKLVAQLNADREAREAEVAAAQVLQQAMRDSGVTKMTHRSVGTGEARRERAAMMLALARLLNAETEDAEER